MSIRGFESSRFTVSCDGGHHGHVGITSENMDISNSDAGGSLKKLHALAFTLNFNFLTPKLTRNPKRGPTETTVLDKVLFRV